jgi:CubicO group peptidase (beta-lactamase class C family)
MDRFLEELVEKGVFSSVLGLVGTAEEIVWEGMAGDVGGASLETRFDFASLTKPFTATLAVVLDRQGVLPLSARIGEVWPEARGDLARRPLSDLLRHRSGLAAWAPLYHLCRSREDVLALILQGDLPRARAGTYSDLGYILWSAAAERRTGEALEGLMRSRVLAPLGLDVVEAPPGERPDVARSFMGTGKEMILAARMGFDVPDLGPPPVGLPQDGNARFLRGLGVGVPGHAGLFGGVRDLWRLGAEWLAPGRLLQTVDVTDALAGGGGYALGWARRTLRGSAGPALSPRSFGLTGFAGNSLWIDPEQGRVYVLLGSRLDPASDMNRWRRRFHRLARSAAPT